MSLGHKLILCAVYLEQFTVETDEMVSLSPDQFELCNHVSCLVYESVNDSFFLQ